MVEGKEEKRSKCWNDANFVRKDVDHEKQITNPLESEGEARIPLSTFFFFGGNFFW